MATRAAAQRAGRAHLDLRAAPRLVAARRRGRACPSYREIAAAARRVPAAAGLHARRADADHRASVLRLVGLPDHRLLRAHARATARRRISCTWSTCCTRHGIGVILDWVPSHFPDDRHGLARFDGTHLYEHADPRRGFHPEWKSNIFNYGRHEVRAFLHLERAVLARPLPHRRHPRGRRGLDALPRLRRASTASGSRTSTAARRTSRRSSSCATSTSRSGASFPTRRSIAEESTSWPQVSRPVYAGGLGFAMKWNMGWMHDTLDFMAHDPIHRRYHHNELTFSLWYAFTENFVLPLSHDEVVYGKKSLASQDARRPLAAVRQPAPALRLDVGAPGQEAAVHGRRVRPVARVEPRPRARLGPHATIPTTPASSAGSRDLNRAYRGEPRAARARLRRRRLRVDRRQRLREQRARLPAHGPTRAAPVLVVCNFTPVPREGYRVGVPLGRRLARDAQQRRARSTAAAASATSAASSPQASRLARPRALGARSPCRRSAS